MATHHHSDDDDIAAPPISIRTDGMFRSNPRPLIEMLGVTQATSRQCVLLALVACEAETPPDETISGADITRQIGDIGATLTDTTVYDALGQLVDEGIITTRAAQKGYAKDHRLTEDGRHLLYEGVTDLLTVLPEPEKM